MFVHILHEEITVCVGADEDCYDTDEEDEGHRNTDIMIRNKNRRICLKCQSVIDRVVLVDEDGEKRDRKNKTGNIRIQKYENLGDVPVEKIPVDEEEILSDLLEIGKVSLENGNDGSFGYFEHGKKIRILWMRSIFVSLFLQAIGYKYGS